MVPGPNCPIELVSGIPSTGKPNRIVVCISMPPGHIFFGERTGKAATIGIGEDARQRSHCCFQGPSTVQTASRERALLTLHAAIIGLY